jgi:hypothetical protein
MVMMRFHVGRARAATVDPHSDMANAFTALIQSPEDDGIGKIGEMANARDVRHGT